MKIYGIFDPDRNQEELTSIMARMSRTLDPESRYQSDQFAMDGVAVGRLFSQLTSEDLQPIWNEGRTRFIVSVGKIFDYEERKRQLLARGHDFKFPRSDGEFILHAFEEWGDQCLEYLNGVFAFALYDTERRTLTVANDRHGMKPVFYNYRRPSFTFASTVVAVLEDHQVKREINWDAWRDFFCYRYVLGTKTFFSGVWSLPNATILTVTNADLLSGHYWDYARISVDHDKTPEEFVNEGTRLVRQAIKRRCTGLKECVVMLSGGYDSRCIAGTISRYTKVRLQTFTTRNFASIPWGAYWTSYVDAFLGREVAKRLGVRNTYVPTPSNLWQEYFVKKNFLVDAMTYEHLWMLPLIDKLEMPLVGFDGLGGDYLLKGVFLTRRNLANTRDLGKLAAILNAEMRSKEIAPETISDFFCTPVREQLQPDPRSLLDELRHIGEHENPVIIFLMTNRARNVASLLPNSIAGTRIPCVLPFTDNDLVEFSLSIPPLTKMSKQIYFRILKKLFPDIMRIPSANWWGHPSNIKEATIHHLLLTIVQMARSLVVTRISDTRRKLQREAIEYLMGLISSVRNPPFLDVDKVRRTAQQYLNHKKDPSTFLVAIADFCIWYNRYFDDGNQSHTKHGFPSSVVYHESGAQ